MNQALFRFYAELNDFLPPARRFTEFRHQFLDIAAVKDFVESFGVPHTEVDLILVNGEPVDFSYRVRDGDRISVYPVFEAFDIAPVARLRPEPLREPRFVLDVHLGRLAAYLRMLGFDALYRNDYADDQLAAIAGGIDAGPPAPPATPRRPDVGQAVSPANPLPLDVGPPAPPAPPPPRCGAGDSTSQPPPHPADARYRAAQAHRRDPRLLRA